MTNSEIIDGEIKDLESQKINYAIAQKLAWLYILKDHSGGPPLPGTNLQNAESDFLQKVRGKSTDIWNVIDELMTTLQITNPRLYDSVIRKL